MRAQTVRDRLGTLTPAAVRPAAFALLDRLQRHQDPVLQLTALAVTLAAMSEAAGLRMRDVINVAENTLADAEGPYTEHIQAIRAYARGEWLGEHHDQ